MTSEFWCFVYCSRLAWDVLRFVHKHYRHTIISILIWFDKVWAPVLQKIRKYFFSWTDMKQIIFSQNIIFSKVNIDLEVFSLMTRRALFLTVYSQCYRVIRGLRGASVNPSKVRQIHKNAWHFSS